MKISIIIPTFNGSRFLAAALKSACEQTYADREIIVVDDCSTDDSAIIASRFPVDRIVQNPERLGMVRNWNQCFELASGEWIKFLHQDDILNPICLEVMAPHTYARAKIVATARYLIFEDGISKKDQRLQEDFIKNSALGYGQEGIVEYYPPIEFAKYVAARPLINQIGEPSCVMFHRSALEAVGAFNENLIQLVDWEYFARIALWTGIVYIDRALAGYRLHAGSQTRANFSLSPMAAQWHDPIVIIRELAESPYYRMVRAAARPHDFWAQYKEMTTVHALC